MDREQGIQALSQFYELMQYNGAVQAFKLASEMKLLAPLYEQPLSYAELGKVCDVQEKPLQLVMNVLEALKLVEKQEEKLALTATARFFAEHYQDAGQSYWDYLPKYLKTGEPLVDLSHSQTSETYYAQQVHSLFWLMSHAAHVAASHIAPQHQQANCHVLDVGAGSGVWSLTLAKYLKQPEVTLNDWPEVLEVGKQIVAQQGLEQQVSYLAGDFHDVEFKANHYDVILIGNVIHLEDDAGLVKLIKRVKPALRENGQVYIIDTHAFDEPGWKTDSEHDPLTAALYELGLGVRTSTGKVHTPAEVDSAAKQSGFSSCSATPLQCTPDIMMLYTLIL